MPVDAHVAPRSVFDVSPRAVYANASEVELDAGRLGVLDVVSAL